jgi:predicted AlkP superfamily phosphohydrolase/phosphomutase
LGSRVLAIGLDGFDLSLAERMIAEGLMPSLARLKTRSARFTLDDGSARYSGLAWEHVSSALSPMDGGRWSAVSFDPETYAARQEVTRARPFLADLAGRTIVFDLPYCDLKAAPAARGITNWGAHDPGVAAYARPEGLREEVERRFGPYPAARWIYGFTWPSVERTEALGEGLRQAVEVRAAAARWLLAERLPDWDLAIVVVSEGHSAIEPLWHGVDPQHPLRDLPSAAPARDGLHAVYAAIDRLVGTMYEAFPDARLALFAPHGMGPNQADVAAMLLLPELMFRHAFGRAHMRAPSWSASGPDGTPMLGADEQWEPAMAACVPEGAKPSWWQRAMARLDRRAAPPGADLAWMPATRYRAFWPRMPAFALPSYYDGRIRINLQGREARGIVPRARYHAVRDEIAASLSSCRNSLTGEPVIEALDFPRGEADRIGTSEADIYVRWHSAPLGLDHPAHGRIGPVPYRRTGGHTGGCGFLWVAGEGVAAHDGGAASAFDVVPTLVGLAGLSLGRRTSGRALALSVP